MLLTKANLAIWAVVFVVVLLLGGLTTAIIATMVAFLTSVLLAAFV